MPRYLSTIVLFNAVALASVSAGCATPASETRYPLSGVVASADPTTHTVEIAHGAVEGLMPAMTMPFTVRGPLPGLSPTDRVTATLVVTRTESWLEHLVVSDRARPAAPPRPSEAIRVVGATPPDVRLRTHDGRPFTFGGLTGQVVLVTFFFTRCPLPDYCPRIMSHLTDIARTLDGDPALARRTRLVAITLDPAFDTPTVLKAYGARVASESNRVARLDLVTGPAAEIQAIAGFFGVTSREQSGSLSHSLSTAVVGTDGRVLKLWTGNTWSPAEVLDTIKRATRTTD